MALVGLFNWQVVARTILLREPVDQLLFFLYGLSRVARGLFWQVGNVGVRPQEDLLIGAAILYWVNLSFRRGFGPVWPFDNPLDLN